MTHVSTHDQRACVSARGEPLTRIYPLRTDETGLNSCSVLSHLYSVEVAKLEALASQWRPRKGPVEEIPIGDLVEHHLTVLPSQWQASTAHFG